MRLATASRNGLRKTGRLRYLPTWRGAVVLETEMRLRVLGRLDRLARVPALARAGAPRIERLVNRYYDTPHWDLARAGLSLRVRRVDGRWVQTLKLAQGSEDLAASGLSVGEGQAATGLSVREEWEWALAEGRLSRARLRRLPAWQARDPSGAWLAALRPCFMTRVDRQCWTVRRPGGASIEVSLDQGEILAGVAHAPICELELEWKAGTGRGGRAERAALWGLARSLARQVPVLPEGRTKPQRGATLAMLQGDASGGRACAGEAAGATGAGACLGEAAGATGAGAHLGEAARTGAVTRGRSGAWIMSEVLRRNIREFVIDVTRFCDICREVDARLVTSDGAVEGLHQLRVAWRRLASSVRFFRPMLPPEVASRWTQARRRLRPLLEAVGALRDLDVAMCDTLPPLRAPYLASVSRRDEAQWSWDTLMCRLEDERAAARADVLKALMRPEVGGALLDLMGDFVAPRRAGRQGSEGGEGGEGMSCGDVPFARWARQRLERMERRLGRMQRHLRDAGGRDPDELERQHCLRILAKRLRYVLESLPPLKGARACAHRLQEFRELQARIGAERDRAQAAALVQRWGDLSELAAFVSAPR